MNIIKLLPLIGFFGVACLQSADAQKSRMVIKTNSDTLSFEVKYRGNTVITSSPLGLNIDKRMNGIGVKSDGVRLIKDGTGDKTYQVQHSDGRTFEIDVREFDDGVAFRYRIPAKGNVCIYGEQTAFTFPSSTQAWYASGPFQYGWIQAYQDRPIEKIDNELLAPPATFRLPSGLYAAITEANLFNYHGAVLFGRGGNRVQMGYVDNKGHLESGVITGLPASKYWHSQVRDYPWIVAPTEGTNEIKTPWRILMLADDLNGLVNNKIIESVSDKPDPTLFPKGANTEWIKPSRAIFTWLVEGGVERLSLSNHKKYVDGCAELGIEVVVVDDGWELWPQQDPEAKGRTKWEMLKELVDYASAKGVDIWVWRSSSPRFGNKEDIGVDDPQEREKFMSKCAEIGVKGLKIDFFHTENLFTVNLMEKIVRSAAKHKLMVVLHGVNKPTGDSYTYPNLMAKEAVRGLESVGGEDTWAPGPAWPYHNTVLPFTRWLAGAADYTPLNFRAFCPPSVTFGHQLSSIYMFTSPMLILAADMEDMLSSTGRKFIESVPVTWDETVVMPQSQIGELAAIARRKGEVWYLTVLNGEQARSFETRLEFLPKGRYIMEVASDAPGNRKQIEIKRSKIGSGDILKQDLMSGGGFVVRFDKL